MDLKERFLKYVSYDTQSSEESTTFPSTEKQKVLLAALRDEMEALGMTEVTMDQYGYVMGTVPASKGCENAPVIGFIAHVDTSPDMSGANIKPRVIEEYDGSDIALQLTTLECHDDVLDVAFPYFGGVANQHYTANEQDEVLLIQRFGQRWLADDVTNQAVRANSFTLAPQIGFNRFSDARAAWLARAPVR